MNREFLVREDLIININSLTTTNTRGAAGSTNFPSKLATRTDEYELYALSFMKFFVDSSLKFYINRSTSNQVFDDPDESYPIFSEHDLELSSMGVDFKKQLNTILNYKLSAQQKSDRISSTDLSNQEISSSSISFLLNYLNNDKDFKISPSMRYDKQSENDKLSYNVSFESIDQLIKGDQSYFDFGLDIGSSFQFPTMNDLYWPDGLYSVGNLDLKPEESDYLSFNMTSNSTFGKVTVTATMKDYENLILWQPDASYKYQPINVSSASRITYNINYLKEFSNSQLQVSYNIYDSEDDDLKKKLLYVPEYSANVFLAHNLNQDMNIVFNYKYIGKRILQYGSDLSSQTDGDGYGILDLSISKDFNDLKASLVVDNILDKAFESTLGYPEPGRSIKMVVEYKI
jgi:outer membrane cobalamin receptor